MNILIITLVILVALVTLFFLAALFIKNEYLIERKIIINKSHRDIYDYVKLLKNQDFFNKWVMTDPGMSKKFSGIDGTTGFIYAWDGNDKAGKGEQEIIRITSDRIDCEIRFERPFKNTAYTHLELHRKNSGTEVVWGMSGTSKYPMNVITKIMTGVLRKDLDISLNNLKNILENDKQNAPINSH